MNLPSSFSIAKESWACSKKLKWTLLSLPNCTISCEVTGKRVNRGGGGGGRGYGLEIPFNYKFLGPGKAINWIQKM